MNYIILNLFLLKRWTYLTLMYQRETLEEIQCVHLPGILTISKYFIPFPLSYDFSLNFFFHHFPFNVGTVGIPFMGHLLIKEFIFIYMSVISP